MGWLPAVPCLEHAAGPEGCSQHGASPLRDPYCQLGATTRVWRLCTLQPPQGGTVARAWSKAPAIAAFSCILWSVQCGWTAQLKQH